MKDFLKQDIQVGDEVVFVQLGYRHLLKGVIVKMTEKTVLIKHPETNVCSTETKQFGSQVIKITGHQK